MSARRLCSSTGRLLSFPPLRRAFQGASDLPQNRVAILGASGALGQSLALMLKRSAFVSELALYDEKDTRGMCADLSHIATNARITGYRGPEQLPDCLRHCSVVVMMAGKTRQSGVKLDDLFEQNANTVANLASAVAQHCPKAKLCMLTSPLNSNVPLAAEILRRHGVHDPRRLFGVTAVDSVRARVLLAQRTEAPLDKVVVPVLGGHSGATLVPAFSQAVPHCVLSSDDVRALTDGVRGAADAVVAAKAGDGSATLSVAAAAHKFVHSLMCAMDGRPNLVESAFVESDASPEVPFLANPLLLGRHGVERNLGVGKLSEFEAELLGKAVEKLKRHIEVGQRFAQTWAPTAG